MADSTDPESFSSAARWKEAFDEWNPIPTVLLAHKHDLVDADPEELRLFHETMDQFCREHDIPFWFRTEARSDRGVRETVVAFTALIEAIIDANHRDTVVKVKGGEHGSGSCNASSCLGTSS